MRTVTVRNLRTVVPARMKLTKTVDVAVDYTAQVDLMNVGRLAVDNELTRIKYCT
jgi:hypothetical protein